MKVRQDPLRALGILDEPGTISIQVFIRKLYINISFVNPEFPSPLQISNASPEEAPAWYALGEGLIPTASLRFYNWLLIS